MFRLRPVVAPGLLWLPMRPDVPVRCLSPGSFSNLLELSFAHTQFFMLTSFVIYFGGFGRILEVPGGDLGRLFYHCI